MANNLFHVNRIEGVKYQFCGALNIESSSAQQYLIFRGMAEINGGSCNHRLFRRRRSPLWKSLVVQVLFNYADK